MKDKFLYIINHFNVETQQRKLNEEVLELQFAIIIMELMKSAEYEIPLTKLISSKNELIGELADVLNLVYQFKEYYEISDEELSDALEFKVNRTLDRIDSNYYDKKENRC